MGDNDKQVEKPAVDENVAKKPAYPVPSADDLAGVSDRAKEKEIWYDIDDWQMSVKIRPVSFGRYMDILHDMQLQSKRNPQHADLQAQLSWIHACLVEPKLNYEQIQKLADADMRPVSNLALKCQVISGHLPEEFDPDVESAKNVSEAEQTETDTGESTPPA